jgi:YbbR domain-containing protein
MNISMKKALINKHLLKISSLLIGYSLWLYVGELYPTTLWSLIPLCFYNQKPTRAIQAQEHVWVQLQGTRSRLCSMNKKNVFVHINAQELQNGTNYYALTTKNIILPNAITIRDIHTSPVTVQVTDSNI